MWYKILIGLAVLLGVFGLIKLIVPDFNILPTRETAEAVGQAGAVATSI